MLHAVFFFFFSQRRGASAFVLGWLLNLSLPDPNGPSVFRVRGPMSSVRQEPPMGLIAAELWRISAKKRTVQTLRLGEGEELLACCLPDGVDSRVAALVVFDELCSTKAKHLEQPCGPSIWPGPYLPEPDAPNNCELNSMNDSWRRDARCARRPASSSDGER